MGPRAFILVGPTAAGKTGVAHLLADRLNLRLLSTDSMLVYRGMDIGTAKPGLEERAHYRYLGVDLVDPSEPFSTGTWLAGVARCLEPGETVIAAGGTGLYTSSLLRGLDAELPSPDPALRERMEARLRDGGVAALQEWLRGLDENWLEHFPDAENPRRLMRAIEILELQGRRPDTWEETAPAVVAGLHMDREALVRRIARRVDAMFEQGLLGEIESLMKRYPHWSRSAIKAIGYEEGRAVLEGRMKEREAREQIIIRTRRLAKRQMTWFRNKLEVEWVEAAEGDDAEGLAARVQSIWERTGPAALKLPPKP